MSNLFKKLEILTKRDWLSIYPCVNLYDKLHKAYREGSLEFLEFLRGDSDLNKAETWTDHTTYAGTHSHSAYVFVQDEDIIVNIVHNDCHRSNRNVWDANFRVSQDWKEEFLILISSWIEDEWDDSIEVETWVNTNYDTLKEALSNYKLGNELAAIALRDTVV